MILCINIGNSNIALGVANMRIARDVDLHTADKKGVSELEQGWLCKWRLSTVLSRSVDEYFQLTSAFLRDHGLEAKNISAIAIASVVPSLNDTFARLSLKLCARPAFFINPNIQTGSVQGIQDKAELGADLIANAVAGHHLLCEQPQGQGKKTGLVVVDFGTALTFTVLNSRSELLGVVIAPGINSALKSLVGDTAQLPYVELKTPPQVIGTNTIQAIQSGLVHGFTGLIESMIKKIQKELNSDIWVLATGGLHHVIESKYFDRVEPWLQIQGVRLLYELNC